MTSLYFEVSDGAVLVGVTVTERPDGTLQFDLSVLDDHGHIGDLNGLFFDVLDDGLASGLSVSGTDVTGQKIEADGVTKVDGFNNVNGEVARNAGKFDVGVSFGTRGESARTTSAPPVSCSPMTARR